MMSSLDAERGDAATVYAATLSCFAHRGSLVAIQIPMKTATRPINRFTPIGSPA